jgi:hypothetical protein
MHPFHHLLASLLLTAIHPIPTTASPQPPSTRESGRTVIGGHGLVILPGSTPIETPEEGGQESRVISVGGSTYRVVAGIDTTVDGIPIEDIESVEVGNEDGSSTEEMSAGKKAAVAFAETAERILLDGKGRGSPGVGEKR